MPEERTNRTGRPREGLRVGPWLGKDSSPDTAADPGKTGPSWTAPTAELRPATPRRTSASPADSPEDAAIAGAETALPGSTGSPLPIPGWLREYGWLFASGTLALIVLIGSSYLLRGPDPVWRSDNAAAITTTAANGATPTPAALAVTATPQRASGTPSATTSPSPRRSSTQPSRKPSARPRPSKTTAAAPVLLGPADDRQLWGMLSRYCAEVHDSHEAQLRSGTSPAEGNWECRRRGPDVLIDMTAACRHGYGSAAFARYSDRNNAFSWRCYRQP